MNIHKTQVNHEGKIYEVYHTIEHREEFKLYSRKFEVGPVAFTSWVECEGVDIDASEVLLNNLEDKINNIFKIKLDKSNKDYYNKPKGS